MAIRRSKYFLIFLINISSILIQLSSGGVIRRRSLINANIQKEFENEIQEETETFFNHMFSKQIEYFNKVKAALPASSKRVKDIETYVENLQLAIKENDVSRKDDIYFSTFQSIGRAPLLLNNEIDTGLTDEQYQHILNDNGLKDFIKDFLVEVAVYFWKMAKASGKAVEATVEEYLSTLQQHKNSL